MAAQALLGLAAVEVERGELDLAWAALEQAMPALEGTADLAGQARALNSMGLVERKRERLDAAYALHERARAAAARAGDLHLQAVALRNLAGIDRTRGDLAKAAAKLLESADLQEADGDPRAVALIWRQVRAVEAEAGRLDRALAAARRELALRERLGEAAAIAATLLEAAELARRAGEVEEAERWLARAAELRAHAGDWGGAARALLGLGRLLLDLGRPRAARRKLEAARDALGERGAPELRSELWRGFAEGDLAILDAFVWPGAPHLRVDREDVDRDVATDEALGGPQLVRRAREEADEALALAEQASQPELLAPALRTLARAHAHQGHRDPAREHFRRAVEAAEGKGARPGDLDQAFATYLAYGWWLGDQAARASDAAEGRAALDYLQRALALAEAATAAARPAAADVAAPTSPGAQPAAGPIDAAVLAATRAGAALGALRLAQGDREGARAALAGARDRLGPPLEPPASHRARLRRALDDATDAVDSSGEGAALAVALPRLVADADAAARAHLARLSPDELRDALFDLRRLQEVTKALVSEGDLDRLLALILDAALELARAERGFVILTGEGPAPGGGPEAVEFRATRNLERTEVERPDQKVSNTIARQALRTGEPVVTGDAAKDDRFAGALSVAEQRLKSVACVPLVAQGRVVGALYLDHRFKEGLFGPRALDLLESLAGHAALALERARSARAHRSVAAQVAADRERLRSQVQSQTIELADVKARLAQRAQEEGRRYRYDQIVGRSPPMQRVFALLDKVVESNIPVFIHGESGTGKELIARAIHFNSPRAQGPFVSENFAALVDELLESELFGHVKGSFTGAIADKKGLFERANGGTLFLDEVGDLSEKMQKELLRVLEEREVRPIGSGETIKVDVRLVSATHRDLKQMVAEGTFRQDLFYRLHVFAIQLPPLRDRREDVPLLVERFLEEAAREAKGPARRFDPEALRALVGYAWPGNVRELKNFVDRTLLLAKGDVVRAEDIQFEQALPAAQGIGDLSHRRWAEAKEEFARAYLMAVLQRTGGNISTAARETGMLRQAFQRLLRRHGVDPAQYRQGRGSGEGALSDFGSAEDLGDDDAGDDDDD